MCKYTTQSLLFSPISDKKVEANFDGGSDAHLGFGFPQQKHSSIRGHLAAIKVGFYFL